MSEEDWERDEAGGLKVSMLTGFATAFSPDGAVGIVRVTFADDEVGAYAFAAQIAMGEQSVRDLSQALKALADKMRAALN